MTSTRHDNDSTLAHWGTPVRETIVAAAARQTRELPGLLQVHDRQVPVFTFVMLGADGKCEIAAIVGVVRVVAPQTRVLLNDARPGLTHGFQMRRLTHADERNLLTVRRKRRLTSAAGA